MTPAGVLRVSAFYRGFQVAGPVSINLTSNVSVSIPCAVHSLSVSIVDPAGRSVGNASLEVYLEGFIIGDQSSPSSSIALDGLINGEYLATARLGGVQVAATEVTLNGSRSLTVTANVSELVLTAKDVLGFPMQGARVLAFLPDGSTISGYVNETGDYSLDQIPMAGVTLLVDSGSETRVLSVESDESRVEIFATFPVSSATVALATVVLVAGLSIIPQTRRLLGKVVRAIPLEVSVETERQDLTRKYSNFLSSVQLHSDETVEVKGGEVRVVVVGGGALPRVGGAEDHLAFLVSDSSVMPPRREIRLVKEAVDPKTAVVGLSRLVHAYSEEAGIKVLGVLVCDEVTDEMLGAVRELHGAEVVYAKRRSLSGF